ncbi:MAG: monovalent cation/H+ antiporter complex subunit F [Verrucomicrobia bacterium]|jgi:multisubunit Na+/H+ antiporter MnhF subunit|nr:monovalent cation/H+ antiporter complex subunit F [Verrucomicrobiota bacterium]
MNVVLIIAFLMLAAAVLAGLLRLRRGPSVLDRILAFDLVSICVVGMVVLLSVAWRTSVFIEAILIVSLLGFFTTVAFVSYLSRQRAKTERQTGKEGSDP